MKVPRSMIKAMPNVRVWQKPVADGYLEAMRTVEPHDDSWRTHISICHKTYQNRPGRYPTWDEQKEAVRQFAPDKRMISIMPADPGEYVNVHQTTFHWWEFPGEDEGQ